VYEPIGGGRTVVGEDVVGRAQVRRERKLDHRRGEVDDRAGHLSELEVCAGEHDEAVREVDLGHRRVRGRAHRNLHEHRVGVHRDRPVHGAARIRGDERSRGLEHGEERGEERGEHDGEWR
jgi:hypothetical protein